MALFPTVGGLGVKVAKGTATISAAAVTVVTGLATVAQVVVSMRLAPTVNVTSISATIGDQAGSPAAGSFIINAQKPTDAAGSDSDQTPVPATTFSDAITVDWVAFGT